MKRDKIILLLKIISVLLLFFIPLPSGKGFDIFFGMGSIIAFTQTLIHPNFSIDLCWCANLLTFQRRKVDHPKDSGGSKGDHIGRNHPNGTALDINRINGERMTLTGLTPQITELQKAFDEFQYIRENFGPYFKHKYYIETNTWNYNYPVGGRKDHIHVSIRK